MAVWFLARVAAWLWLAATLSEIWLRKVLPIGQALWNAPGFGLNFASIMFFGYPVAITVQLAVVVAVAFALLFSKAARDIFFLRRRWQW